MKLHTFPFAPNPRKLDVYLKEKGLEIPTVWVNLAHGEQKRPEFLARNPLGNLPVLELDDGSVLTESLAIIEFLEELHPEPPMIGTRPVERARVRRLERICELGVLARIARIVHATKSPLPGVEPDPAVAAHGRKELEAPLGLLDREMDGRPFVAGEAPSIADCTLFGALSFGRGCGVEIDPGYSAIHRWFADFARRPSTRITPPE